MVIFNSIGQARQRQESTPCRPPTEVGGHSSASLLQDRVSSDRIWPAARHDDLTGSLRPFPAEFTSDAFGICSGNVIRFTLGEESALEEEALSTILLVVRPEDRGASLGGKRSPSVAEFLLRELSAS